MKYILEGTTKRYQGNGSCKYQSFTPKEDDLCRYGSTAVLKQGVLKL